MSLMSTQRTPNKVKHLLPKIHLVCLCEASGEFHTQAGHTVLGFTDRKSA